LDFCVFGDAVIGFVVTVCLFVKGVAACWVQGGCLAGVHTHINVIDTMFVSACPLVASE